MKTHIEKKRIPHKQRFHEIIRVVIQRRVYRKRDYGKHVKGEKEMKRKPEKQGLGISQEMDMDEVLNNKPRNGYNKMASVGNKPISIDRSTTALA